MTIANMKSYILSILAIASCWTQLVLSDPEPFPVATGARESVLNADISKGSSSSSAAVIAKNAVPPLLYGQPDSSARSDASTSEESVKTKSVGNNGLVYIPAALDTPEEAVELVKRIPGSKLVGRMGELANAYLLAVPEHLSEEQLKQLAATASATANGLGKRDAKDLSEASEWKPLVRHRQWKPRTVPETPSAAQLRERGSVLDDTPRQVVVLNKRQLAPAAAVLGINDPEFQDQWHLNNSVAVGNDVSAISAWTSKITGRNITVTLIDDGLDYTHPDLKDNFDADASYDFNLQKPLPYPAFPSDTHGTRCAGEIGARPGNGVCGVGLAYDAKLAGIRLLSGDITVADEVAALNYQYERVDVYSNSWGPDDDGATVAGPSRFTQQALVNAANNGRAGRGNVMVFAAGNGAEADNCNYDGFANNLYTVSIGAVDIYNEVPWYGEPCVAHMVVGYSSNENVGITTTDRGTGCASDHGGTSAATPLASAIVALILQARPSLTVRDVHDILRKSALKITPVNNTFHTPQFVPRWTTLPSGLSHSDYFAYGRIDAARALLATRAHKPLPPRLTHKLTSPVLNSRIPYSSQTSTFSMRLPVAASITVTNSTTGVAPGEGLVVERVGARVWVTHPRRGHLAFQLISPAGIVSNLATPRPDDTSNAGLPGWQFTSVKHWGEPALGEWKLAVADLGNATTNGTLVGWELEIHGHSGSLTGEVVDTTFTVPNEQRTGPDPILLASGAAGAATIVVVGAFAARAWKKRSQQRVLTVDMDEQRNAGQLKTKSKMTESATPLEEMGEAATSQSNILATAKVDSPRSASPV